MRSTSCFAISSAASRLPKTSARSCNSSIRSQASWRRRGREHADVTSRLDLDRARCGSARVRAAVPRRHESEWERDVLESRTGIQHDYDELTGTLVDLDDAMRRLKEGLSEQLAGRAN